MNQTIKKLAALLTTLVCVLALVPLAALATEPTGAGSDPDNEETTEYITEDGKWEKNGDTWTYTFDVFDDTATFYLWEEYMEDYLSDAMSQPVVIDGKTTNIATITNTFWEGVGDLTVSKTVAGGADPYDATFTFNVQLTGEKIHGAQAFGGVVFQDGAATFKLKHGESRTFTEIPAGTTYTVTETPDSRYTTSSSGEEGTIESDQTAQAMFTNTVIPHDVTKEYRNITLEKKVDGTFETSGEYTFYITLSGLENNSRYTLSDGTEFTADSKGNANLGVTLEKDESVVLQQIPVGATYQISEQGGEYQIAYSVKDNNGHGKIASTAGSNEDEGTALSTSVETVDAGEDAVVTFTNTLHKTQNLKLRKVVDSEQPESAPDFNFNIVLSNLLSGARVDTSIGRFTADQDGTVEIDTFLTHNGEVEFYDLPVGTQYRITEEASQYQPSYQVVDANGQGQIASASDAKETINTSLTTGLETVNEGEDVTVTFTNTQPERTSTLTVSKMVTGKGADTAKEFTFTVTLIRDEQPLEGTFKYTHIIDGLPYEKSATLDENGAFTFTLAHEQSITIKDLPVGTSYTVVEESDPDYDLTEHENDNGTIPEEGIEATFENTRHVILIVPTGIEIGGIACAAVVSVVAGAVFVKLRRTGRKKS